MGGWLEKIMEEFGYKGYAVTSGKEARKINDSISREATIKLILSGKVGYDSLVECPEECNSMLVWAADEVAKMPSAQPERKWIPVSERMPEDIRPVIVTWKNNDPKSYYRYIVGKHFIGTAHYHRGKWYWYSSTTEDLLAEYGRCDGEEIDEAIEVIAWMPLPEPWKGEEDGE